MLAHYVETTSLRRPVDVFVKFIRISEGETVLYRKNERQVPLIPKTTKHGGQRLTCAFVCFDVDDIDLLRLWTFYVQVHARYGVQRWR